ncbi:MAG: sugar transferase [Gammaproteobacteria bacterium]|nr:sugar transferase [Gammaproteobacteria bacterium]
MKRVFDIIAAGLCLVILCWLFALIALLILLTFGRPIIFSQQRPGLHGNPFVMLKFRTMKTILNEEGALLPDEDRMTSFGCWLRRTSMDELPSLWNVLCGEMSLVGPRPLLMEYLALYSPEQVRRHDVRPGITGWAQVNGRNAISWEEKFRLDVWYVDNKNIWLDIKILFLTIVSVFKSTGINQEGHVTAEKFRGSS